MANPIQSPPIFSFYSPPSSPSKQGVAAGSTPQIQVSQASLKLEVVPKSFEWKTRWFLPNVEWLTGPGGKLAAHLEVQDNQIPLRGQNLLEASAIRLIFPWQDPISPDRISLGDLGQLHFIAQVSPSFYHQVTYPTPGHSFKGGLVEKLGPILTPIDKCVGLDRPARGQIPPWERTCFEEFHYDQPKLELGLQEWAKRYLPGSFFQSNGRFPEALNLNKVLEALPKLLEGLSPKPGKPKLMDILARSLRLISPQEPRGEWDKEWIRSGHPPKKLGDLLEQGYLRLEVPELKNFFVPGWIDLGTSSGIVTAYYYDDGRLYLRAKQLDLKLDPMVYGSGENSPRLLEGRIVAGPIRKLYGQVFKSGLSVSFHPERQEIRLENNLDMALDINIPILGTFRISTPVIFKGILKKTHQRWDLKPGSTLFGLPQLKIQKIGESPQTSHWQWALWDNPKAKVATSEDLPFPRNPSNPEFRLMLQGDWNGDGVSDLELSGRLWPTPHPLGGFDWDATARDLEYRGSLTLPNLGGNRYDADLGIDLFEIPNIYHQATHPARKAHLKVNLQRDQKEWLMDGAELEIYHFPETAVKNTWLAYTHGDWVDWGPINLNDIKGFMEYRDQQNPGGSLKVDIPRFDLEANPSGSRRGLLQGPIEIHQVSPPSQSLTFHWNPQSHIVQWEGLNLLVKALGVAIPKKFLRIQSKTRREKRRQGERLGPKAAGFGLDGKLKGHFEFDMEKLKGQGLVQILGDPQGDIYVHTAPKLDPQNPKRKNFDPIEVIQPPLFRETKWDIKKISRVLWDRGFAYGVYHLFTRFSTAALSDFGMALQYDTDISLHHRDVMFKPGGIEEANLNYYRRLFREYLGSEKQKEGGGR